MQQRCNIQWAYLLINITATLRRIIIIMSVVHRHQYYLYLSFYFYAHLLLLNCHCPGVYAQDTSRPVVLANSTEVPIRRVHYGYFPEASPIRVACARGWFKFMQYEVTCYPQTSGKFISDLFCDVLSYFMSQLYISKTTYC